MPEKSSTNSASVRLNVLLLYSEFGNFELYLFLILSAMSLFLYHSGKSGMSTISIGDFPINSFSSLSRISVE